MSRQEADTLISMVCPASLSKPDLAAMAVFGLTLRPRLKAGDSVFRLLAWNVKELDVRERFHDLMWVQGRGRIRDQAPVPVAADAMAGPRQGPLARRP